MYVWNRPSHVVLLTHAGRWRATSGGDVRQPGTQQAGKVSHVVLVTQDCAYSSLRSTLPEGESNGAPAPSTEETPAGTPSVSIATPAVPQPTGADPLPAASAGGNGHAADAIQPPPGIADMPPLSATAMASFATAANGVATQEAVGEGNPEGRLVLNSSSA